MFFDFLLNVFLPSIVGGGAAAGLVAFLGKALVDKRITESLKDYEHTLTLRLKSFESDLSVKVHQQNTIFDRLDQQRADAAQKLYDALYTYHWHLLIYPPQSALRHLGNPLPLTGVAMEWAFQLQRDAQDLLRTHFSHALLFDDELTTSVIVWYQFANQLPVDHIGQVVLLTKQEPFNESPEDDQRRALVFARGELAIEDDLLKLKKTLEEKLKAILGALESDRYIPRKVHVPSN